MKTLMFPGQGSQKKGMGGDLFDRFKALTQRADDILGYSIKTLCLEDPDKTLGKTQFTQPALYVVNALSYYAYLEDGGDQADFVVGHSLGEFNALLAAQCYSFESGLKLVKMRGELMSKASEGAMAAVLNATKQEIEQILADNQLDNIDLANFNTASQIVISGKKDEIIKAQAFFQQGRMVYHPLNTSGAFHSRFMKPSGKKFATYLKKFKLSELQIPVISNVTAQPHHNDQVLQNLSDQISSSVRWSESVEYLINQGSEQTPMTFVEIGHGDVLTKLVTKIKRELSRAAKKTEPAKPAKTPVEPTQTNDTPVTAVQQPVHFASAEAKVADWNNHHPVGSKVKSTLLDYDDLETSTEAVVLFGHRAAVYMKGYNGYFDLDELSVA